MKRTTAFLLAAILLLSCVPIAASAAQTDTALTSAGTEAKFRLLLEDLELKWYHHADDYFYHELAQYPEKDPEWVLIRGGLFEADLPDEGYDYNYAVFGNKLIRANVHSTPFRLGYGVYDVKSGAFYDIIDAWNMNLNNLRDVWDSLKITDPYSKDENGYENNMYVIGDADRDGEVTILDATRIQRCIAELDENPWEEFASVHHDFIRGNQIGGMTDYDRDGDTTVLDATRIQRGVAELPNILDYRLAWDERFFPYYGSETSFQTSLLINDLDDPDLDNTLLVNDPRLNAEKKIRDAYDDSFFETKSLLILNVSLGSGTYRLTLSGVSIDKDGVLNVDFTRNNPVTATTDINERFICIELSKAFLDDIRDIKTTITPIKRQPKDIDAKLVYEAKVYGGEEDNSNALINSREALEAFTADHLAVSALPAQFDDAYFKTRALVGATFVLGSNGYQLSLDSAVLEPDYKLRIKLTYTSQGPVSAVESPRLVLIEIPYDDAALVSTVDIQTEYVKPLDPIIPCTVDAKLALDIKSGSATGTPVAKLLTNRTELFEFSSKHVNNKKIPEKYDDAYFATGALIGLSVDTGSGSIYFSDCSARIEADGTLRAFFTCTSDYEFVTGDLNPRFVLAEIPNSYNSVITGVKAELGYKSGFRYSVNTDPKTGEKSVVINGYAGSETDLTIPSEIEGYPVTGISAGAFHGNPTLRSVSFPYNAHIDVGQYAFSGCTALESVDMQYKPLDEPIEAAPQTLTAPERKGFTAVEWGGCLIR